MQAVIAAIPEEKASPCFAPSAAAKATSQAPRVGFPVREYSNPLPKLLPSSLPDNVPALACAKVVAKTKGGTTACGEK